MGIKKAYRDKIIKEFKFIVTKMNSSPTGEEKLYYFSGTYGIVQRVFNLEYDEELVFLHFVLRQIYDAFNGRLNAIKKGGETVVPLTEEQFVKLSELIKKLAEKMTKKEDTIEILKKFVILGYTTTGNGYYMQQQGEIDLENI